MSETNTMRRDEGLFTDMPHSPARPTTRMKKTTSPARRLPTVHHGSPRLFTEQTPPVPDGKFTVVSMFSGCGGMDLGFHGGFNICGREYDLLPFEVIWANEHNKAACRTYRKNLGVEIKCEDVWAALDSIPEQADVLIGGFPCQDVSVNGKRVGVNGKRTGLYKAMIEGIKWEKPKIFICGKRQGIAHEGQSKSTYQVVGDCDGLGYIVKSNFCVAN